MRGGRRAEGGCEEQRGKKAFHDGFRDDQFGLAAVLGDSQVTWHAGRPAPAEVDAVASFTLQMGESFCLGAVETNGRPKIVHRPICRVGAAE